MTIKTKEKSKLTMGHENKKVYKITNRKNSICKAGKLSLGYDICPFCNGKKSHIDFDTDVSIYND